MSINLSSESWPLKQFGETVWTPSDHDKDDDCDAEGPKRPIDVPTTFPGDPEVYKDLGELGYRDEDEGVYR